VKRHDISGFLKDLGLRVAGAVLAVGLVISLAFLGDFLDIGFLDSGGGLLIGTIVLMEALFFTAILYLGVKDRI